MGKIRPGLDEFQGGVFAPLKNKPLDVADGKPWF